MSAAIEVPVMADRDSADALPHLYASEMHGPLAPEAVYRNILRLVAGVEIQGQFSAVK